VDANAYAAAVTDAIAVTLWKHGHTASECAHTGGAFYDTADGPELAIVVCGCGVVFPAEPLGTPGGPAGPAPAAEVAVWDAANPVQSVLDEIDPTRIYTPAELEARILDCIARIERGLAFENECVVRAYEARQAFVFAEARALVDASGRSESVRKAEALVACEAEFQAMTEAEMLAKATKAAMHNLRAILSGFQSVARSVQSAYQGTPR
jgi:hypothetical protein